LRLIELHEEKDAVNYRKTQGSITGYSCIKTHTIVWSFKIKNKQNGDQNP